LRNPGPIRRFEPDDIQFLKAGVIQKEVFHGRIEIKHQCGAFTQAILMTFPGVHALHDSGGYRIYLFLDSVQALDLVRIDNIRQLPLRQSAMVSFRQILCIFQMVHLR
jgi:hypothetical protein